ncbi:MAG: hypothetical protein FD169_2301 [Bacillota bacterium]|nr:MAG: hypothetical protein FD169_2301 [Bacillota bacterium]
MVQACDPQGAPGLDVKDVQYMSKTLETLYTVLDFQNGSLLSASAEPGSTITSEEWVDKGEWLAAAKRAGADRVFFVENNPVVVFAECGSEHADKAKAFNRIWSLGRPRLLFLASPGEISVLDLAQKPLNYLDHTEKQRQLETLKIVQDISRVADELEQYHRNNIESGRVFEDSRFGDTDNRADKALIRDLKVIRRELIEAGLSGKKVKYAHALIGRSIFIRYLEDRGILTRDYFMGVAGQVAEWHSLIKNQSPYIESDLSERQPLYPRVLENKPFTYALFRALARDFNGDMFPDVGEEEQAVTQEHLKHIQGLLYGDVGIQKKLFFYSYSFDIVPLDLISSIYEEFYHSATKEREKKGRARQEGAYYTPSVLVELVLSRVLTSTDLAKKPRVLDPACGSGIFLVDAFRRMVRYEWHNNQETPDFNRLKQILHEQIAGIEINEEAARITAFSLCLALLNYLNPPAIAEQIGQGNKLPSLLVSNIGAENQHNCIWVGNAFDTASIESHPLLSTRFGKHCADIVASNPPWGAPGNESETQVKDREDVMLEWCRVNSKTIGDKEPSQAFLWRSLDFLRDGGRAGMLVAAGVLLKNSATAQEFRKQWLNNVTLHEVFNFTHVRKLFFAGANSPFMLLCFSQGIHGNTPTKYWSAKQTATLKGTQSILLSKYDLNVLRGEDLSSNELWKIYWFGREADSRFIRWLQLKKQLRGYIDTSNSGRGYELASCACDADRLQSYGALLKLGSRYEPPAYSDPPRLVHRFGAQGAYVGLRVIVNEGISESIRPQGSIIAQYAEEPFCFYRRMYGLKLLEQEEWCHKVLLAILWSSFARYYFFMTSANWGLWHHKLLLGELLRLPVVLEQANSTTQHIVALVDLLRNYHPQKHSLFHPDGLSEDEIETQRQIWERKLDEAVFELYGLSEEQKDLIRDCCEVTLPFFYKPFDSVGSTSAVQNNDLSWIENYVRVFSRRWNAYLGTAEMRAEVHIGAHGNMVAIEFYPADKADPWDLSPKDDSWQEVLGQIGKALPQPLGTSQILMDGVVHVVSAEAIIVIKRNEKRFWTRSLAREDADATLCKRMLDTKSVNGGLD